MRVHETYKNYAFHVVRNTRIIAFVIFRDCVIGYTG